MFFLRVIFASASILFCCQAIADQDLYGVISGGYAETDFSRSGVSGGTVKFGIGYQFHRQWYVEVGVQQLADESGDSTFPESLTSVDNYTGNMKADGIYAALLGKASGRMGELYYRVGILKTDVRGSELRAEKCYLGLATEVTLGDAQTVNLCQFDEGGVAGVFGVGFDFYAGINTMIRLEAEHISGEHDLSVNSVMLGLRYNF